MISVCMACFNGEAFIAEQIKSILQSDKVDELIISDDGSTDLSVSIIQALSDPRIKLLKGPQKGLIKNFEFLLQNVAGEYIFLTDQDDIWLDSKVDESIKALQFYDLIVSDCKVIDESGKTLVDSFYSIRNSGPGFIKNLTRNSFLGCCMAFRRSILAAALPFPEGVAMHDWWIGLIATLTGKVYFIEQQLVLYRRHGSNASDAGGKTSASKIKQMLWRIQMVLFVVKRFIEIKFIKTNVVNV